MTTLNLFATSCRWLLLRFDFLGALSVCITSVLTIGSGVSSGSGGMAILASQGFVQAVYWLCRFWSQLEMDLNSIERVGEYLALPQEPPAIIEENRAPAYWPSSSGETLVRLLSFSTTRPSRSSLNLFSSSAGPDLSPRSRHRLLSRAPSRHQGDLVRDQAKGEGKF